MRAPLLLAAAGLLAAACTSGGGTDRADVQPAVATTFARLYVRQQTLADRTGLDAARVAASAACDRGGPAVPDRGAGDDWTCRVTYTSLDLGRTSVTYDVTLGADGCYRADGPPGTVGQQQLPLPDGGTATNPLYAFIGCTRP